MKILRLDKIICILFLIFLLAVFELSSRLIFPLRCELDKILNILQQDSELFWRQRPNLNLDFHGARVRTSSSGLRIKGQGYSFKKPPHTFRIVCLGASPTFGWGVKAEESYPYQLETALRQRKGPDKRIEVINCGNIGYSSYQGLLFFKKEVLSLSPDLITISYLANDVDKHRFFRSGPLADKELKPKNRALVFIENILNRSRLFQALNKLILRSRGVDTRYYGTPATFYPENRRVSPEDYRKNLSQIIDIAAQNRIKVVLIKMPIGSPFKEISLSQSAIAQAKREITSGLGYLESGEYQAALSRFKEALKHNPHSSPAFYYLGLAHILKREPKAAEGYFQKAKEMEFFECAKLSLDYNQIMQALAGEKRVALVDITSAFKSFGRKSLEPLYVDSLHDYLHPSIIGHRIISRKLADRLIKSGLLPVKDINRNAR